MYFWLQGLAWSIGLRIYSTEKQSDISCIELTALLYSFAVSLLLCHDNYDLQQ